MMKALIVDDSRAMRMMLSRIVTDLGYDVEEAPDAEVALERLQHRTDVSLMLVDCNMPGMSGLQLIERIRLKPPEEQPKIVMVTSDLDIVEQALVAGADEFLTKPFEREAVIERIRFVLGQAS